MRDIPPKIRATFQTVILLSSFTFAMILLGLNRAIWAVGLTTVAGDTEGALRQSLDLVGRVPWWVFAAISLGLFVWIGLVVWRAFAVLTTNSAVLDSLSRIEQTQQKDSRAISALSKSVQIRTELIPLFTQQIAELTAYLREIELACATPPRDNYHIRDSFDMSDVTAGRYRNLMIPMGKVDSVRQSLDLGEGEYEPDYLPEEYTFEGDERRGVILKDLYERASVALKKTQETLNYINEALPRILYDPMLDAYRL